MARGVLYYHILRPNINDVFCGNSTAENINETGPYLHYSSEGILSLHSFAASAKQPVFSGKYRVKIITLYSFLKCIKSE